MAATAFSITCASVFGRVMMRMSAKHMAPKVLRTSPSSSGQGPVSCRDWSSFQSSPGIQPINNWDNVHNYYCHISSPHGEYKHYWSIPTCWWTRSPFLIIKRMKMMLNNFLPFNVFGIAPSILEKIPLDLNWGGNAVQRTANGLVDSFFVFTRRLSRRKSWKKVLAISANKRVLENIFWKLWGKLTLSSR